MMKAKSAVETIGLKLFWLRRIAQTTVLKQTGLSDVNRWADKANLFESWDERTQMLASFIPAGSKVLEFGAGRMILPHYLPEGCVYTPSDIVERGPGTIVCDLNATQLPPFPFHDVILFSGVLEYVYDLPHLISHLAHYCYMIVASYAVTDFEDQKNPMHRRRHGWVNDWSAEQLQELFHQNGFGGEQVAIWEMQPLFKFVVEQPRNYKESADRKHLEAGPIDSGEIV